MGVLLMAMTIGGLAVAAILFAVGWLNESAWLKKFVVGGVAIWMTFYFAMLLGASFLSREQTIEVGDGDGKAFCGFYLDCHMHTAVTNVRRTKSIGGRTANGEFYIVTVKVFSDAKKATLGLATVDAHVADDGGRTYIRDLKAEAKLNPQLPFETQIGPEENFDKEIVFDLPVDVKNPRLDISEGWWADRMLETFLIGDEDSIFHKRNYFGPNVATKAASR